MPELPEIETIKNILKPICQNQYVVKSDIHIHKLRYPILPNLSSLITNRKIINIRRRAKYLVFEFNII